MYRFVLLFKEEADYSRRLSDIQPLLEEIKSKWKASFALVEAQSLTADIESKFIMEIRNVPPQARGKIVSSKNRLLPLTHSKRLNLENTPILIMYSDNTPVNVYPHALGTTHFEIEDCLHTVLNEGPKAHMEARGLLEEPVIKILADNPSILEENAQFECVNVDVGTGTADIILKDQKGRSIVVEVETHANDFAVGQVSRLTAGYASKQSLPQTQVRKAIVCQSFDKNLPEACKEAGIELYKVEIRRVT